MWTFRREHFSPDFEGPFHSSCQLSKSSTREKNQVQKNLDLHFAINISGNSPFGTPALTKNAEKYEWQRWMSYLKWYPVIDLFDTFTGKLVHVD